MAKKPRTAKQLANDERLRQAAKAKKEANQAPVEQPQPEAPASPLAGLTQEQKDEMLLKLVDKVDELTNAQTQKPTPEAALATTAQMQGAVIGKNGIQGIQYRYPVDKGYYPDPIEQLLQDEKLRRFALAENYLLFWDVEGVTYEANGITYAEPRFVIEMFRRMFDEEGNEKKDQMVFVNRLYLDEDELAARIAAERMGLTDSFDSHEDMMNAMRVFRIKQWLHALFFPTTIKARKSSFTQVIDGKAVEIVDREEFTDASSGIDMAAQIKRETAVFGQD